MLHDQEIKHKIDYISLVSSQMYFHKMLFPFFSLAKVFPRLVPRTLPTSFCMIISQISYIHFVFSMILSQVSYVSNENYIIVSQVSYVSNRIYMIFSQVSYVSHKIYMKISQVSYVSHKIYMKISQVSYVSKKFPRFPPENLHSS